MATNIHEELAAIRTQLDNQMNVSNDVALRVAALTTQLSAYGLSGLSPKLDEILAKLSAAAPTPIPTPVLAKLRSMIVTYFRSDAYWASVIAIKPPFVQINPGNGDALTADSLYVAKYGERPEADVLAAVKRQQGFYPGIKGVFVDTVGNGHGVLSADACLAYYGSLVPKLTAMGLEACLNLGNVGAKTPEKLALLGRYAMTREMAAIDYMKFTPLPWEIDPKNAGRFWHVAHGCSLADMPGVVARMARNGAGLATVTDDSMVPDGNPYNMPPSYITQLDAACKAQT
jgi:hypothetical protein